MSHDTWMHRAVRVAVRPLARTRAGELGAAAGFDPDDSLLAFPVLIWFDWAEGLLAAASLGAPVFVLFMFAKFRGRLRIGGAG